MAAAVHAKLVLVILAHIKENGLSANSTNERIDGKFVEIPLLKPHCFVYGIYYDAELVCFFAHIPVLTVAKSGTQSWVLLSDTLDGACYLSKISPAS